MIDAFVAKIDGSATIDPLYLNMIVGNIANFDVKGMKLGSFTSQFAAFLLSFGLNLIFKNYDFAVKSFLFNFFG